MDIIKIKNEGYAEYEELLLKRDRLEKEAKLWKLEYMAEFGDLITEVFEKKIACIRLKKTIAFCQAAVNQGKPVDREAQQKYISAEMKEYQRQLKTMIDEHDAAQKMEVISQAKILKIKKLYRKLTKLLHPDIHPETDRIPELKNIWMMINVCYTANDLEGLQEAEALADRALRENHLTDLEIEIPNLEEKIEKVRNEIYKIETTDPYQYKYFLADHDKVEEKRQKLHLELSEYENYEKQLKQILDRLYQSGGTFVWRMS